MTEYEQLQEHARAVYGATQELVRAAGRQQNTASAIQACADTLVAVEGREFAAEVIGPYRESIEARAAEFWEQDRAIRDAFAAYFTARGQYRLEKILQELDIAFEA